MHAHDSLRPQVVEEEGSSHGSCTAPRKQRPVQQQAILPDYNRVTVTWTHNNYEEEEIDIPTEEGERYIRGILGMTVLWNKEDTILDLPMPQS
jgi:hypothetical protein